MAKIGWVKVYRKIEDCEIWTDKEPFDRRSAWIDLLMMANHEDKKIIFRGKPLTIKAGQKLTSIYKLAEKWHWSRDRVRRYLMLLEALGMITRESDSNKTIVTIVNYSVYQESRTTNDTTDNTTDKATHNTTDKATRNTQTRNNKNDKEVRSKEVIANFYDDAEINDAFADYVTMRKSIKKPMTDKAIALAKSSLKKLSGGDKATMIAILNQSVMYSWQGLFPLKEKPDPEVKRDDDDFFRC